MNIHECKYSQMVALGLLGACLRKKNKNKIKQTIRLGLGSAEPPEPGRTCRHGYCGAAPLPSISRPLSFMSLFVHSREIAIAVRSFFPPSRAGEEGGGGGGLC